MARDLLILDFETYFDSEYSLRKMTTAAYILDARFEMQLAAVKLNKEPHRIIEGADFPAFLATLDPANTVTVTFNSLFDNSILAWRYGFVPHMMLDAMGMARCLLGHKLRKFSLRAVADHLELGSKGESLKQMQGKRAAAIKSEGLWKEHCDYAIQDNVLCEGIFNRLLPLFPQKEQRVMDLVLRCCVEPSFVCDIELLRNHLDEVRQAKAELLNACPIDAIKLMSSAKFEAALKERGVPIQTKISPTGRVVPQFARTDPFMQELQEWPDIEVQAMAAARLGLKSTIEETRAEKLLSIAELPWPEHAVGNMPVPLRYGGAHTHRLSGDWGMNMQNMPADRKKDGKSKLRASLKAPEGHAIIVADLGQIECRLSGWLCKAETLMGQFERKEDPYAALATQIFGRMINRKVDHVEGFIGKTGILGLGYGCGKERFFTMAQQGARVMGIDQDQVTREICDLAVDTYRTMHKEFPTTWRRLDSILEKGWAGVNHMHIRKGVVEVSNGVVHLPNNLKLYYHTPKHNTPDGGFVFEYGGTKHDIYGAKLLENVTQALARIVVMDAAIRLYGRGLRFRMQAHDELVFIVRQECVDEAKQIIHGEMIRPPDWATDLPLTADVGVGDSYAEAK